MRTLTFSLLLTLAAIAAGCSSDSDDETPDSGSSTAQDSGASSGGASSSGGSSSSGGATDAGDEQDAAPVTATKAEVQAILNATCDGCHIGQAQGGLRLNDVADAVGKDSRSVPGQKLIVAGEPDQSVLLLSVEGEDQGALAPMPQGTRGLPAAQAAKIRAWIAAGAQ